MMLVSAPTFISSTSAVQKRRLPHVQKLTRVEQHPADAFHAMLARQGGGPRGLVFPWWAAECQAPGALNLLGDILCASLPLDPLGEAVRLALNERVVHQSQSL